MEDFIGQKLEDVIIKLEKSNISYKIVENDHKTGGDVTLVTNQRVLQDKTVLLTVGKFIFQLKD